jgi:carboxylate-amine ligase
LTQSISNSDAAAKKFDGSLDFTIGIEEEFQLLDPSNMELVHRFEELERATSPQLGDFVRGELIASEIEICTDFCDNMAAAETDLRDKRRILFEAAAKLGIRLCASGTHPFADWRDQRILDTPHYRIVEERLRYCAWRNTTFGMHTHIGVRGHERIIAIFNAMRGYLPQLLALSANSPFAEGRYTYLHSTRTQLFTKFFPRCNIPGPFNGWSDYADYIDTLYTTGSIDEITQIWWSVRPHPLFGTLEVRICDCQSDIRDTLAISALILALTAQLASDYDEGKTLPVLSTNQVEENFWRAIRYGLDGGIIDYSTRREVPTKAAISSLLEYTAPSQTLLGLGPYAHRVADILKYGNGAQRQIRVYKETGDIATVHRQVIDWTRQY